MLIRALLWNWIFDHQNIGVSLIKISFLVWIGGLMTYITTTEAGLLAGVCLAILLIFGFLGVLRR